MGKNLVEKLETVLRVTEVEILERMSSEAVGRHTMNDVAREAGLVVVGNMRVKGKVSNN